MKKNKLGIGLAVLGLSVGFAAVSTTLYINGTATLKANNDNFKQNVIFTAASIDAAAKNAGATDPVISADSKTITFTTQEFNSIGDTIKLNYTVANNSDYKAQFATPAVVCTASTGQETDFTKYLTLTHGHALDGLLMDRSGSQADTLDVTMKSSYNGDEAKTITFTCTIDVEAVEATN